MQGGSVVDNNIGSENQLIRRVPHRVEWTEEKITKYWDVFGAIEPVSPWFSVKAKGFILNELEKIRKDYFTSKEKITILDMGSGSGDLLAAIHDQLNSECYGVDLSPERVANACEKFKFIHFSKGSLTGTSFPDKFFDLIISTQTIEHLMNRDLALAFKEFSRILKPGGLVFLTTRFDENLDQKLKVCPDCLCIFLHSQHLQSFSQASMQSHLEGVGINPIINKRSRCRDNFNEYTPSIARPFLERILYYSFRNLFDRKKGKYLYTVGIKSLDKQNVR